MYTVQMVSTASFSLKTACVVFENISHWRNNGQKIHSKDKGEGEEHIGPVCQSIRCHLLQMTSFHSPKWICQMNPFMCMSLSCCSRARLFLTWTAANQTPLSMGFFRKEHWSGLPYSPLGIFLTQGLNLHLLQLSRQTLYCWATGEAWICLYTMSYPYFQKELNPVNILKKLYEMAKLLRYPMSSQVKCLVSLYRWKQTSSERQSK